MDNCQIESQGDEKIGQFLRFIQKEGIDLKPFPNEPFSKAFDFDTDSDIPVILNIVYMYMYIILRSWRESKIPYYLSFADFTDMVLIPKPPFRVK